MKYFGYEKYYSIRADMKMCEMEARSKFSIKVVTQTHQQFTFANYYFYKQLRLGCSTKICK